MERLQGGIQWSGCLLKWRDNLRVCMTIDCSVVVTCKQSDSNQPNSFLHTNHCQYSIIEQKVSGEDL